MTPKSSARPDSGVQQARAIRPPGRVTRASSRAIGAVVWREHHATRRRDPVEAPILELQRLDVAYAIVDLQAALLGSAFRLLDQRRRQVDAHDLCTCLGGKLCDRARPAGEIEKTLARLRAAGGRSPRRGYP